VMFRDEVQIQGRASRSRVSGALLLAFMLLLTPFARAAAPSLDNIAPRGGQRGTEVPVTFAGSNLEDAESLLFHEEGIDYRDLVVEDGTLRATLLIAPDCALGTQAVRVHTRSGVSNLQLFSVGNLPEITEEEPNHPAENAMPVELNTTINGVITREDVDYFAVDLEEGQRMAVQVEGLRLGRTLFDPLLRLYGPNGHELLVEDDTQLFLQDAGFVHIAEEAGRYLIAVSEARYGGDANCDYRLHIGEFPMPLGVSPLGGVAGEAVTVHWLADPKLDSQEVVVPALEPGTHSIPVETDAGAAPTHMPFRVSELPGVVEEAPNNTPEEATPGVVPGAFDGVISEDGEVDYFRFAGTEGQVFDVRVWARELGSPLDSVLSITNPSGSNLVSTDEGAGLDSATRVTLAEDGDHIVAIHDHLKRGGPEFFYRIEFTPVTPGLSMRVLDNRPASLTVPRGGQAHLLLNVNRRDFDGPIQPEFLDLPEGLTVEAPTIPAGQTTVPAIVTAGADAPVAASLARLEGVQQDTETPVRGGLDQEVVLIFGQNQTTFFGRQVDRLAVAVAEEAPFTLEMAAPKAPIVQGGHRMITIHAARAEGFDAPIALSFPWLPPGMSGGTAEIPGDAESVQIRLEVQDAAAPGDYELFVAATGGGHEICTPFTPVEVEERWLTFALAPAETDLGKPVELVAAVTQRQAFEGSFEVSLGGLPRGVTAKPQPVDAETTELRFTVEVAEDAPKGKFENIFAQTEVVVAEEAVVHVSGGGQLTVHEPLPEELQAASPEPEPEAADPEAEAPPERRTRFPST